MNDKDDKDKDEPDHAIVNNLLDVMKNNDEELIKVESYKALIKIYTCEAMYN